MSGKDVGDEVLREMAQTGGIFLSPVVPRPGRKPVLLRDLAQGYLDAREALRGLVEAVERHLEHSECYSVGGNDGDDALRAARACLPDPRGDEL